MKVKYPKVKFDSKQRIYVTFYLNNKRFRLFNGKKINCEIYPNSFPIEKRLEMGSLLAAEVYKFITSGLSFNSLIIENKNQYCVNDMQYLSLALNDKLKGDYSTKYKSMLRFVYNKFLKEIGSENITSKKVNSFLNQYVLGVSYNTIKRHLSVLINEAMNLGMEGFPMESIKSKKTKAKLHKPYSNIKEMLDEIKLFNDNLHLCCLMTYGCLLRPHREIRELTWGDFSDDLKYINLSGHRNKSGRNRIVPVPLYIRDILVKGEPNNTIFSNKPKPLNQDYFKTLWSRFKKQSDILEQGQTLYSFRHSGAIEIFKRTGSLTKLQKAMGHSSLNVSLTYLRGLEVAELNESDMPNLNLDYSL